MQIKSLRPLVEDGSQCELIFDNGHKITIKPSNSLWDEAHATAEILPFVGGEEGLSWQEQVEARLSALEADRPRVKTNLERAIEENGKGEPKPDPEPPADVAALLREDEAYGAAAERLAKEMADLENKRFLQIITPADERKYETLKRAMRWFEARGAVEVI